MVPTAFFIFNLDGLLRIDSPNDEIDSGPFLER